MKIGILGAGSVGTALAVGWAKADHHVKLGVRDPHAPKVAKVLSEAGANATAGTVSEAVEFGTVVVLATPWSAIEEVIVQAGDLSGKVVLDCTNPLKPNLSGLELGHTTSAGERVQKLAPSARVVKIFNTTGYSNMENPVYADGTASMPYCGDDDEAKQIASQLAADLGFDPIDAGPLSNARLLEPLAMLWIWLAMAGGQGREIAFKLMKR